MPTDIISTADIPSGSTGVFVLTQGQIGAILGDNSFRIGIIGAFQWGVENVWYDPSNPEDLMDTLFPFGTITDAYKAISNVRYGLRKFFPVGVSGTHVKATLTKNDVGTSPSFKMTALNYGSEGNNIKFDIIVNATTATSRDIRVYVTATDGTVMHDETYLAVQVTNGTVTDPGDPYVLMEMAGGGTDEAVAGTGFQLAGGTSGTLTAAAYLAGITAGLGEEDIDIFVVVGAADALIDDIRAGMKTAADANPNKLFILPTPVATSRATAITEVASYRGTWGNIRATWPCLRRTVQYSHHGYNYFGTAEAVDGGLLLAAMIQRTNPWDAVFKAAPACVALSGETVGLETGYGAEVDSGYAALAAAGIMGWVRSKPNNNRIVPYNDVTTTISSVNLKHGDNVRYALYLKQAIGDFLETMIGQLPLDIDLANLRMGPGTSAVIAAIEGFLQGELRLFHITAGLNADLAESPAFAVDPYSNATAPNLALGIWGIYVAARKTPNARQIILSVQFGTSVNITIVKV